jgi:GNAT superfamily N-acetyltransferase
MTPIIRQARRSDVPIVVNILREAATWLRQSGKPMWRDEDITEESTIGDIGLYFLAEVAGEPAGTVRFQIEDRLFWPDIPEGESAFIHRLAVRRRFAGTGLSTALLSWAVDRTRSLGKKYLRLDCDLVRPSLRAVYENFGFIHHSDRVAGPYLLARYEYKTRDGGSE